MVGRKALPTLLTFVFNCGHEKHVPYQAGHIRVFIGLWSRIFTRLTAVILEISTRTMRLISSAHPMVLESNEIAGLAERP